MKHIHSGVIFSLILALMAAPAGAAPSLDLPGQANGQAVVSLGKAKDPKTGKIVEGIAYIHYKKGFQHRNGHDKGKPGDGGDTGSTCYSFLSKGAKWRSVEPWVANTANQADLDENFVAASLAGNIDKWENASGADILGTGSVMSNVLAADTQAPDGVNEIYFADVAEPGAIAVTIVWGVFSGPPFARELVEWDQVYDDVDFAWANDGSTEAMDFENISTHEHGHAVGMGHPEGSCTDETMYAFADNGETKKRDLNAGDIAGIGELY